MNINILRLIDKHIGYLLIKILSFSKKNNYISGKLDSNSEISILIIKYYGFGSILLASPSFNEIKKLYPKSKITILTLVQNREICNMLPSIDEVITITIKNPKQFILSYIKAVYYIRELNIDYLFDLEFLTNFSALSTLCISLFSKMTTVGFLSPLKSRNSVYSFNVSFDHSRHITKIFLKVFNLINITDTKLNFDSEKKGLLKNIDHDSLKRFNFLNPINVNNYNICVNINSAELNLLRRWPKENYLYIVNELVKDSRVRIILTGGKQEKSYVDDFFQEVVDKKRLINLCGIITLTDFIGVLNSCNLLITNDSGPLHVASVLDIPTISFFGPETPYIYGPKGDKHTVFYEDIYCSPCINIYNSKFSTCNNNICLKQIEPKTVLDKIYKNYLIA